MQQSNPYVLFYAAALTIVCGTLLALAAQGLKPLQEKNKAFEKKKNILSIAIELKEDDDIEKVYNDKVSSYVVNAEGKKVESKKVEEIDVEKEYKKEPKERLLPVYEVKDDQGQLESIVMPVYGYGLWDNIWGYIALKNDLNTVNGVVFDHKGETPGLGARITSGEIQERYEGKKIYENGDLTGIVMQKGERGGGAKSIQAFENDPHAVDGMSGATITGKGLNEMITSYLDNYSEFLNTKKKK